MGQIVLLQIDVNMNISWICCHHTYQEPAVRGGNAMYRLFVFKKILCNRTDKGKDRK